MWLIQDAISYGKDGKVYAYAGEELKLISTKGEVLIVENPMGERFPIKKEFITLEMPINESIHGQAEGGVAFHDMVRKPDAAVRRKKRNDTIRSSSNAQQDSLF